MNFPREIYSGVWQGGHCQGIAVDREKGWVYYSFTTMLVKTDLRGNILGTVKGLLGHLGCIAMGPDGQVYGSLEYKHDAIGKSILNRLGTAEEVEDAFYMAIFDGEKISKMEMDACRDGVMKTVYLKEVVEDYKAQVTLTDGRTVAHRFGCSGIDGTSFGPLFGAPRDSKKYLFVAYGIYSDESRADNDYQVLLCYDPDTLRPFAQPLSQADMHHKGPEKPDGKYFIFTGNTTYGIQNLEYDAFCGHWLMAVYRGRKAQYPNHPLYIADGTQRAVHGPLRGHPQGVEGDVVSLWQAGAYDAASGVYGWDYAYGQTGLFAFGNGRYYVSYDGKDENGWYTRVRLCRWDGKQPIVCEADT